MRAANGAGRAIASGRRDSVGLFFPSSKAMRTRFTLMLVAIAVASQSHGQIPSKDAGVSTGQNKKCDTLERRIAKEQSSLASFEQTIATDKRGRESCSTKPMCARYDQAIKAMEARKKEHEARLAKFRTEAEQTCKPS